MEQRVECYDILNSHIDKMTYRFMFLRTETEEVKDSHTSSFRMQKVLSGLTKSWTKSHSRDAYFTFYRQRRQEIMPWMRLHWQNYH